MEIITYLMVFVAGWSIGSWRGVVSGYRTAHREKYGKIFNLEIDETDPTNILCYDLLHNKFLFQVPSREAALNELAKFLPPSTTIVISQVSHESV